jgi:hypothetical protein
LHSIAWHSMGIALQGVSLRLFFKPDTSIMYTHDSSSTTLLLCVMGINQIVRMVVKSVVIAEGFIMRRVHERTVSYIRHGINTLWTVYALIWSSLSRSPLRVLEFNVCCVDTCNFSMLFCGSTSTVPQVHTGLSQAHSRRRALNARADVTPSGQRKVSW